MQARDIALDWVAHNPRHHPPTDKSWENKIIGDRAPYIAYIARAAACEGMLGQKQALYLIESLRQHGRALTENKLYMASNHGLFMDYGLEALAKEAAFLSKAARVGALRAEAVHADARAAGSTPARASGSRTRPRTTSRC